MASDDIRVALRDGGMSAFQVVAVLICMMINMLDGFDVLAIAFAAPQVAREWMLKPTDLGLLFSAGLAGMMVGSLLLSPLADAFGRRVLVLLGLLVISVGMVASAFAGGLEELVLLRALTGLGIGALLSSINTIVIEYSSVKRKDFAVAFMAVGYPIGATIGGAISVYLIASFGWRAVFVFGGILSAILIPIAFSRLPESLDYLLAKRPKNALTRLNALLRKMGRAELDTIPERRNSLEDQQVSVFAIFDRQFFARTALIVCAYFLTMIPFYFMLSWTPKVLVDQGLSLAMGISGAVIMNGCGVVGGLLLGLSTNRAGLRQTTSWFMVFFFAAIVGFGLAGENLKLLLLLAGAVGFFMIGVISGLYAIVGAMYPIRVRNTGTGLALGIGRLGAVVGPYLAGVLIGAGWTRPEYCFALALPLLPAAYLVRRVPLLFGPGRKPAAGGT